MKPSKLFFILILLIGVWSASAQNFSLKNISTIPIPAGQTFTGEWEEVSQYPSVIISLLTDQDGILYVQFSNDAGQHIDSQLPYDVEANVNEFHRITVTRRYYRAYFVNNSASNQSFFRFGTLLGYQTAVTSNLNSAVQPDADSQLVRPTNSDLDVVRGLFSGITYVNKFGKNTSVGSSTITPICQGGFYRTPTAAVTLEVVSSDADDNANGAGAREIEYTIMNGSGDWITETVATHASNGTIAVTLPTQVLRLITWRVSQSGTYATQSVGSHEGTLTIRESGGGQVWSEIPITGGLGLGRSQIAALTVPAGKKLYVESFNFGVQSTKTVNLFLFSRSSITDVAAPYTPLNVRWEQDGLIGPDIIPYKYPLEFDELTDVGFMGITTSGTTSSITVNFNGVLIDK